MTALADLQVRLQQFVLEGQPQARLDIGVGRLPVDLRLAVYFDAYRARLIEALETDYPALRGVVGSDAFRTLARGYLEAYHSRHYSIRWFGRQFPEWLARYRSEQPWLADLAAFEWAMGEAFDAADARPITVADMAAVPVERWPQLRFDFHPSQRLLTLTWDAPSLWRAATTGASLPPPAQLSSAWVHWRADLTLLYRSMPVAEAAALTALRAGGSFADACAALSAHVALDEVALLAASFLKTWLDEGQVCALRD